jgi:S-DNA-T family DNA segregation ATPase FtsK/SpoIIIE
MNPPIFRFLRRGAPSAPLRFYDREHRQWITLPTGQHAFICGVTGSGKSNLLAHLIVNLEPMVRAGACRLYGVDLKGGVELGLYGGLFERVAATLDETTSLLDALCNELDGRNQWLREHRQRKIMPDARHPLIVLVIDEAGELAGGIDRQTKQAQEHARVSLDRLLRLGRAAGFHIVLASQDPRKESVPQRDRCPIRIGLRLNSEDEARMLLGDAAVEQGAAPWLIGVKTPGRGYLYDADMHRVVAFGVGLVPDSRILEIADAYAHA